MRILIVRHGDPDYEKDSLTEKGWKEAALVAERISKEDVTEFFVSPLGRAKDTASLTLKKMNRTATQCEWLREFAPRIHRPDAPDREHISWDWLPQDWTLEDNFYQYINWTNHPVFTEALSPATGKQGVQAEYEWVIENFDRFLAEHGYVRDGRLYRVEKANRDTLVLFCHFGLECILLSRLTGISPMILWHNFIAAPTSVTTIYTEERRDGKAIFRISAFGDISHLYVADEPPAFSGRFCETFDCESERHD